MVALVFVLGLAAGSRVGRGLDGFISIHLGRFSVGESLWGLLSKVLTLFSESLWQ